MTYQIKVTRAGYVGCYGHGYTLEQATEIAARHRDGGYWDSVEVVAE